MTDGCTATHRVDRHFDGTLSASEEHAMREHLPACTGCRARYERRLLLAELDPAALSAKDRIGRGLGLAKPAPIALAARWGAPAMAFAVAAAVLLFFGNPGGRDREVHQRATGRIVTMNFSTSPPVDLLSVDRQIASADSIDGDREVRIASVLAVAAAYKGIPVAIQNVQSELIWNSSIGRTGLAHVH